VGCARSEGFDPRTPRFEVWVMPFFSHEIATDGKPNRFNVNRNMRFMAGSVSCVGAAPLTHTPRYSPDRCLKSSPSIANPLRLFYALSGTSGRQLRSNTNKLPEANCALSSPEETEPLTCHKTKDTHRTPRPTTDELVLALPPGSAPLLAICTELPGYCAVS